MAASLPRLNLVEDKEADPPTGPHRRDSDWGGHPRTHEEDLAWAARRAAVSMAAATLHARDGSTAAHSDDVVHLCDAIADELGIHGDERAELLAAAQLHDVGKVAIPQEILDKRGPLDDGEWATIRRHTVVGEQIVQSVPELRYVARLVRHSHERWDGGGYPDGLSSEEIPLASRIVFCADAFHAIRSNRPYRRGRSAAAALEEIKANAGQQFDPVVVDALVKSAKVRTGSRAAGRVTKTLRSRRLMSLLLTLAIGGSALAAGGGSLLHGDDGSPQKAIKASGATGAARDDASAEKAVAARRKAAAAAAARRDSGRASAASNRPKRSEKVSAPPAGRGVAGSPAGAAPGTARRGHPATGPSTRGRPASPGRSEEAPRRPAVPGKPVGGAPGRSEEAPGRPTVRPTPPAANGAPKATPVPPPAANAPGRGGKH